MRQTYGHFCLRKKSPPFLSNILKILPADMPLISPFTEKTCLFPCHTTKFLRRHSGLFFKKTAQIGRFLKVEPLGYFSNRLIWVVQLYFYFGYELFVDQLFGSTSVRI